MNEHDVNKGRGFSSCVWDWRHNEGGAEQRDIVRGGRLEAHMENSNWPIFPFGCNIGLCGRMVRNKTESFGPSVPG